MDERQRPSGLTELSSHLDPLPPHTPSRQEIPINVPAKVIIPIVIASFALAACKPVNAGTTTPEIFPTGTPAGEVVPGDPTGEVTQIVSETPAPDFTKPSIFEGLYLGQYKNADGSLQIAGQIEGYDSQINTYYREENPEIPAAFSIDNTWLTSYFHATTDKGGTHGTAPDGRTVVQKGNIWLIEETGETFIPFVPSISGQPFGYPVITPDGKFALVDNQGEIIKDGEPRDLFQTPATIAESYGFSGNEQLVTGVDLNQAGQLVVESQNRIIDILTFLNESSKPTELISERMDVVIASYGELGNYPFTEAQKEKLKQAIEYVQVNDQKLGMTRSYWMISKSILSELQEPELAEMLGYIPLAYSEDGEQWKKPGMKDTSNIPIGAQFSQQGNGSAELFTANFDFGIIATDWGLSSFGNVDAMNQGQPEQKRSIYDFITIVDDQTIILNPDPSLYTWGGYSDFQTQEALKYIETNKTGIMDTSGQDRKLIMLPIVYPSGQIPEDFDKLTKSQAESFLQQYVTLMVNRYKDRYFAYVGITEFGMDSDVLMKKIGPEYIDIIYQAIRDADPTAKLIIEQDGNNIPGTDMTKLTQETAQRLKEKNLIDFIASECHVDFIEGLLPSFTQEEMERVFESYPVPAFPSSIDINTSSYSTDPRRFIIQAEKLKIILQASIDANAPFISFWGDFPDNKSWIETLLNKNEADATPWADDFREKPMYFTAESVLLKNYIESTNSE